MNFSAGTVRKIDDSIIEFYFERDVEIDQPLSVEILGLIMRLAEGKPHSLLYNFNKQNIILSEIARKLSGARNYSNAQMIARAIVTQSFSSSLEVTHYINHTNPEADTRIFHDKEAAVKWLREKTDQLTKANVLSEVKHPNK